MNTDRIDDYEYAGRDDISEIVIPDTVTEIGKNAFYNCHNLEKITMGHLLRDVAADVFMNCNKLGTIVIHCDESLRSGAMQVLSRTTSMINLIFMGNDGTEYARILYTDYTDYYDEISPAHVFGRNIQGEGFRMRQCFKDERPDFAAYDATFKRVCSEENAAVAGRMAAWRLLTPVELTEESRRDYEDFFMSNGTDFIMKLVRQKDIDVLERLFEKKMISQNDAISAINIASAEMEWSEGVAFLMRMKDKYASGDGRKRYVF